MMTSTSKEMLFELKQMGQLALEKVRTSMEEKKERRHRKDILRIAMLSGSIRRVK